MMRQRVQFITFVTCAVVFVTFMVQDKHVKHFDLDQSERVQDTQFQNDVENARKQWASDAFEQFDVYASEHMFLPMFVMIFTADACFTALLVYLHESLEFVVCLWFNSECKYFQRITDSLVQDPVQGACGILVAYIMFAPKPLKEPAWQSRLRVVTILVLVLALTPVTSFIEYGNTASWPGTPSFMTKYSTLIVVYALWAYFTHRTDQFHKSQQVMIGYAVVWVAQLCGFAGREYELQQPMQSSPLWLLIAGSVAAQFTHKPDASHKSVPQSSTPLQLLPPNLRW